jgi:hypothetical protein
MYLPKLKSIARSEMDYIALCPKPDTCSANLPARANHEYPMAIECNICMVIMEDGFPESPHSFSPLLGSPSAINYSRAGMDNAG